MATEKIVSYTPEQTATIGAEYAAGATVEAIATAMGKSVRSVIAKLAREKVYVAKSAAKAEGRFTKADLVFSLTQGVIMSPAAAASLEKASHEALQAIVFAMNLQTVKAPKPTEV